jgi:hypothetical protein
MEGLRMITTHTTFTVSVPCAHASDEDKQCAVEFLDRRDIDYTVDYDSRIRISDLYNEGYTKRIHNDLVMILAGMEDIDEGYYE